MDINKSNIIFSTIFFIIFFLKVIKTETIFWSLKLRYKCRDVKNVDYIRIGLLIAGSIRQLFADVHI